MRNATLTFLFAVLGPLGLASGACFLTTEGETYEYGGTGATSSCPVGDPGCPCTSTGVCNDGFMCNPMLNLCIHDACPVGSKGCPCTSGDGCDDPLTCLEGYCVGGPCPPEQTGTESCQCTMGGGCSPGLECLSNVCVNTSGLTSGGGVDASGGEADEAGDTTGAVDTGGSGGGATGSLDGGSTTAAAG